MRYGSLCSGIGGLDLAVEAVFGASPAWFCESDPHATATLRRHWPDVAVLPDVKTQEWSDLDPVEILAAGYPCQPFSYAGRRAGTDDPRHLWPFVADAIRVLRPRIVVLENVSGHTRLGFDEVLADLAAAGFDAEWTTLRASHVGACHRRERLFVVADSGRGQFQRRRGPRLMEEEEEEGSQGETLHRERDGDAALDSSSDAPDADSRRFEVGEEPDSESGGSDKGPSRRRDAHRCDNASPDAAGERQSRTRRARPRRTGSPDDVAQVSPDAASPRRRRPLSASEKMDRSETVGESRRLHRLDWGEYGLAVDRWARIVGRPAPVPVDERGRLSPGFVEWMMGFPEGWVADLRRTAALRCLGNAVVPQQGTVALSQLIERSLR